MSAVLTIHSSLTSDTRFGHSWIEYCPGAGMAVTYGTWGNNPAGQGNGLLENVEAGYRADTSRTLAISSEQEERLQVILECYRRRGDNAWTLLAPCSAFAAEAWEYVTGERLVHRTAMVSNPTRLAKSILAANAADAQRVDGREDTRSDRGVRPRKRRADRS